MHEAPYCVKQLDLFIDLALETTTTIAYLSYELDPEQGKEGDNLVLKGEALLLISIELNSSKLEKDSYSLASDEKTLTIFKLPPKGTITITTEIPNYLDSGKSDLNYFALRRLSFFLEGAGAENVTTKITANQLQFPVLLSRGKLIQQTTDADGQHSNVWFNAELKSGAEFAVIAGKFACIQDYYCSQTKGLITLKIYVSPEKIADTQLVLDALKKIMSWYEAKHGIECKTDTYSLVAVPGIKAINISAGNLAVFDAQTIIPPLPTITDENYKNILSLLVGNYITHLDITTEIIEKFIAHEFERAGISNQDPRWLAAQEQFKSIIKSLFNSRQQGVIPEMPVYLIQTFQIIIQNPLISSGAKADLLKLPIKKRLLADYDELDIELFCQAYFDLEEFIAKSLEARWLEIYNFLQPKITNGFNGSNIGRRKLKNVALSYLMKCGNDKYIKLCLRQFYTSQSMTDRCHAFELLCTTYNMTGNEFILYELKTILLASGVSVSKDLDNSKIVFIAFKNIKDILDLTKDDMYSLAFRFCNEHLSLFHDRSGAGYKLLVTYVMYLDTKDSKLAVRLLDSLALWQRLDLEHQAIIRHYLQHCCLTLSISEELNYTIQSMLNSSLDLSMSPMMLSKYSSISSPRITGVYPGLTIEEQSLEDSILPGQTKDEQGLPPSKSGASLSNDFV